MLLIQNTSDNIIKLTTKMLPDVPEEVFKALMVEKPDKTDSLKQNGKNPEGEDVVEEKASSAPPLFQMLASPQK